MAGLPPRRRTWCIWFIIGLWTLFPASTVVFAAAIAKLDQIVDLDEWCGNYDCTPVFAEIVENEMASRLRFYDRQPIERFDLQGRPQECRLNRPLQPTYFALLIAPGYEGGQLPALRGPANDVIYLSQVLKERGVAQERIRVLTGAALDRAKIIQAMREMLACLRSGDQILVSYDGHGTSIPQLPARPIEIVVKEACEAVVALAKTGLCQEDASTSASWTVLQRLYEAESALSEKRNDGRFLTLLTNIEKGVPYQDWASGRRPVPGLMSMEITNFVNQVRNLDADVFVLIDTAHAAAMRPVAQSRPWLSTVGRIELNRYDVRLTGRGQVGAFYAGASWAEAIERPMSPLGHVGVFSYLFSESLRKLPAPTVGELSKEVQDQYDAQPKKGGRVPQPVMHASNPGLVFMPSIVKVEPNEKDIEIIQPTLKRSAQPFDGGSEATLRLVARYVGKERPYKAIIDGEVVDIDVNGQFRKNVDDAFTRTSLDIRVLSQDFQTLAHRVLRLKLSDQDIILNASGRKLALFIANQDYEDERFNDLQTPRADAEELKRVLTSNYGFSTMVDREDGTKLDLFLVNAGRGAISRILFELRKRLTKEDELIIYYAGHGDNVEGAGSYWIPVDGRQDEYFDWIDADDITTQLRAMNARSILLISDSCYSGGLARGGDAPPGSTSSEARERYLAKARDFKVRQLIASGGEEPVEDGGGGNHSVFAKALINGLATMPDVAFTASELLEQKVKPAVVNMPSAVAERQIPGFHRIAKAGDEIGSEFIFVRTAAAQQAATP